MAGSVKPNTEYVISYDGFSGGLNIRDMEYSLSVGESTDMKTRTLRWIRATSPWSSIRSPETSGRRITTLVYRSI